jgi:hypothetical protein
VSRWVAELEGAGFIVIEPALNQHGPRKIFVAECASPNLAGQKWQAKNGAQNDTSKKTIQEKKERSASRSLLGRQGHERSRLSSRLGGSGLVTSSIGTYAALKRSSIRSATTGAHNLARRA